MTKLLLIISVIFFTIACNKEDLEPFLTGRLINHYGGDPIAHQTVYFYKNRNLSDDWLNPNKEPTLLETATTDENGFFSFTGVGYTNRSTVTYPNASIRLAKDHIILSGNLGKGRGAQAGDITHHNIGNLVKEKMRLDINFKIASQSQLAIHYDSVRISSEYCCIDFTLNQTKSGYFNGELLDQNIWVKNLWDPSLTGYNQYNLYLKLAFYKGGDIAYQIMKDFYFDPCTTKGQAIFEF